MHPQRRVHALYAPTAHASSFLHDARCALGHLELHGEVVFRPDGTGLRRQRANVAHAREHDKVWAEDLLDRCALCRRLDYDQLAAPTPLLRSLSDEAWLRSARTRRTVRTTR
eukprot:6196674-Pleurochrysis_carterae.AAC.1